MRTKARLSLSALICLAFPITAAHGIGFGEIVSQSAIGEPFRAQVRLHGVKAGEGGECLRLSPGPGANGIPELIGAQIGLRQVNGQWRAVITRSMPVFDPVIRMTLEETCSARLKRTYTLLLPLPAELVVPTASAAPAPAPSVMTAPAPRGPASGFGSDALGGTYTLTEASSINALARTLYPDSRSDRRAFVAATRRANSVDRSIRSARQRLATGTTLVIPSIAEIEASRDRIDRQRRAAASAAEQKAPVAAKSTAAPKPQDAAPPDDQPQAAQAPADSMAPEAQQAIPRGDRLMIMGDSPDISGFKLSLQLGDPSIVERTTEAERDQLRREQQLILALDSKIIAQLELRDRIARLQTLQDSLNAELEAQQADTPAHEPAAASSYPDDAPSAGEPAEVIQAPVIDAAPPAAPAVPDETVAEPATEAKRLLDTLIAWWQPLAVAALVLLLGLLWWRRRQPPVTDEDELDALASLSDPAEDVRDAGHASDNTAKARAGEADSFDFSTTEWNGPPPAELDHSIAPIAIEEDELAEEHASAVELADIMMSFGRVHGAAETLSDFIRGNPTQAVQPWIKLLEVYRAANMKAEFEGLTRQLNKTFNVKVIAWDEFERAMTALGSIEEMPHIARTVQSCWGTTDCQAYVHGLLRDTRGGTRQGFPLGVIDELLLLLAVLEDLLGPYRVTHEDQAGSAAVAVGGAASAAQEDSGFVPPAPDSADPAQDDSAPQGAATDPDKVGTESYLPDLDFNVESEREPLTPEADDAGALSAEAGATGLDFHLDSDAEPSALFPDIDANNDAVDEPPPETRSTGLDFDLESDATETDAQLPAAGASEEEESSMSRTFVQTNVDYRMTEDDAADEEEDEGEGGGVRARGGERKR